MKLLACQSPSSWDFNVLFLGCFTPIQSLHQSSCSENIVGLVSTAKEVYNCLIFHSLNKTFLSLQKALESSLSVHCGNDHNLLRGSYNGLHVSQMLHFNHSSDSRIFLNANAAMNISMGYAGGGTSEVI